MRLEKIATNGEKIELVIEDKITETQKNILLDIMYNISIFVFGYDIRKFLCKEFKYTFHKVKIDKNTHNIFCFNENDDRVVNVKISSRGEYRRKYLYKSSYNFETQEDFLKKFPFGKQFKIKKNKYVYEAIRIGDTRQFSCQCCGYFKPAWDFHADFSPCPNKQICLTCLGVGSRFKNIYNISDIWNKIDMLKEIAKELYLYEDMLTLDFSYIEERNELLKKYNEIIGEISTIENNIKSHNKKIQYREELKKIVKPLTVEENKEGIYLIYHKKFNCYKIGISKNPIRRISEFKSDFNIDVEDCELLDFRNPKIGRAIDTEKSFIHYDLKHINVKYLHPNLGVEWFDGRYKELIFETYYKYTLDK